LKAKRIAIDFEPVMKKPTAKPTLADENPRPSATPPNETAGEARDRPRKPAGTRGVWRSRILGGLRLGAYVFGVSLVCAGLGARVVYADFKEGTLDVGRELSQLNDVLGSTKTVYINGEAMNVSTAFTDQSPTEVLDRFERVCADHPSFVAEAMSDIPKTLAAAAEKAVPNKDLRLGIVRSEKNGDGALTCFTDDRPFSLRDFPERVRAFSKSHDLTEFGRFRYVYVSHTPQGNTHVTTIWTEGTFNLGRMFPPSGDAAGFDSAIVPRPENARRILSATSKEVPFGIHVYNAGNRKADVRRFYDTAMESRGWTIAADGQEFKNTVLYVKDTGMMLYVTMVEKDLRTMITTVETARAGRLQDSPNGTPTEATVEVSE
jgi:hypothetical protein